ncbi:Winged helix-turn-helix [uncultured archaeon]|nr:Winged helix-turn-helix [uncultured archaeon]
MSAESHIQDPSSTFCSSLGLSALFGSDELTAKAQREKRRTREEIVYQILEACRRGCKKSAVANRAALNASVANTYLEMLIKIEMIEKNERLYITTRKGRKILPVMKNVRDALADSTDVHDE